MPRVNILKQIRVGDRWRLVSIPHDEHGRYNWKSLPPGRYFIEWWERGKRKRQAAGATTADAQKQPGAASTFLKVRLSGSKPTQPRRRK